MITDRRFIEVEGIRVEVVRKAVKNPHLSVDPLDGQVRVMTPLYMNNETVRSAVISKMNWIRRKQADIADQALQSTQEIISGEIHYFLGQPYRLNVIEGDGRYYVKRKGTGRLELCIKPGANTDVREKMLNEWYRSELKTLIPPLIAKWEPVVGVKVAEWGVKKMKTKWGACNIEARRIWLNLELAKKPLQCLEYIIVHEMTHILERDHGERFWRLMNRAMPQWCQNREILNQLPLANEDWDY